MSSSISRERTDETVEAYLPGQVGQRLASQTMAYVKTFLDAIHLTDDLLDTIKKAIKVVSEELTAGRGPDVVCNVW